MALFKLNNEGIICYMEQEYSKFKLVGIGLEKEPNKVFSCAYFTGMYELNCSSINEYLGTKLKKIIAAQLEAYVRAHSGRYDFYKLLNESGKNKFYSDYFFNMDYTVEEPIFSFSYDELINGVVSVQLSNKKSFQYDFRTNEIKADMPLFYLLYKTELEIIVAKEQMRRGIAPQAFTELFNFQECLKDKQTVSVVFKNGEMATVRRTNFNVSDIYEFTVGQDSISYTLNTQRLGQYYDKGIDDVDYLKLGKIKYQFNGDSLNKLCEPAASNYAWRAA